MKPTVQYLMLALLIGCVLPASAQYVVDFKRTADIYFEKGDYYTAAQYYEKYLTARQINLGSSQFLPYTFHQKKAKPTSKKEIGDNTAVIYRLAESYRLYNDFSSAGHWYEEALKRDSTGVPLARYWYGVCLRADTKYAEAEKELNRFLTEYKQNDDYADKARKELANCRFIQEQFASKSKNKYKMRRLNSFINQGGANYAPIWANNTTLMFTSSRPDSAKVKGANKNPYVNSLYKTLIVRDTIMGTVEKVKVKDTRETQQGVATLSYDGKKMFLTRWVTQDGRNIGALYSSTWNGTEWAEPEKLSALINVQGYSTEQPFVTSDGKYLIFASDRPGGAGKYDLWYCTLDASGNPGAPVNMGTTINTRDDENAPYYHEGTQTLVFSSNGRVGMGGYDLFASKGDFSSWEEPRNLGFPVNSTKDDIYFTSHDTKYLLKDAYFSSDRSSVCCLELFNLRRPNREVSGKVLDCATQAPLVGASVNVVDTVQNKIIYTQSIDATGSYTFELEDVRPLKVVATKNHYLTGYVMLTNPGEELGMDTLISPTLCLNHEDTAKPYPVNRPVVMKNIFYDFNKSTLRPESYPVLDTLAAVMRMYPNMEIEMSAHTDSKGTDQYNLKLSAARAQSCVDYLVKTAKIEEARIHSKGFGECCPIAPNTKPNGADNPDGRALNRRTELKVLHY
ncbi:OmpA family protein [Deminuibacter soli]|uniref:OmpA family protein n=1 Tax=Deminuibacter soli TaxID=2291815 RepID=UPI0013144C88|nr:OmpA family protein [Deminuibacter soli]